MHRHRGSCRGRRAPERVLADEPDRQLLPVCGRQLRRPSVGRERRRRRSRASLLLHSGGRVKLRSVRAREATVGAARTARTPNMSPRSMPSPSPSTERIERGDDMVCVSLVWVVRVSTGTAGCRAAADVQASGEQGQPAQGDEPRFRLRSLQPSDQSSPGKAPRKRLRLERSGGAKGRRRRLEKRPCRVVQATKDAQY